MIRLQVAYALKLPPTNDCGGEEFHASAELNVGGSVEREAIGTTLRGLLNDLKAGVDFQAARSKSQQLVSHHGQAEVIAPNESVAAGKENEPTSSNAPTETTVSNSVPAPQPQDDGPKEPASRKQVYCLLALIRRHKNLNAREAREWLLREHGLQLNRLTKRQAGRLIATFPATPT